MGEYADELGDGFVVLTSNSKPVAAIVSLRNIDPESLSLSTNEEFMAIIEQARRECAEGKTVSLSSLKQQYGL